MFEYNFKNETGPVRFLACYLEVLKDEDPTLHEKICKKHREMMKGIMPDSGRGPSIMELIVDVLQQADKKRFYEVVDKVNHEQHHKS